MAEINWIKLRIDMFDDEKIKIIQAMPDGDSILVIWIRLIALAGKCNANGFVLVEDEFPYNDEMLSVIFNKPLNTVRMALSTFEKFRMIDKTTKGIYITNFEKHQNIDAMDKIREQNRIRKQRERARKNALISEVSGEPLPELPCSEVDEEEQCHVTRHVTRHTPCHESRHVTDDEMSRDVTQQNKNKNKSIYISPNGDIVETRVEKTDNPPRAHPVRLSYDDIMNDYHETCRNLPGVRAISETRKKKIRTLLNELERLKLFPDKTPYEIMHIIFQTAQDSDFLSGRSGKWDGCSFDWLINKNNVLKIIEGNYTNKGATGNNGRTNPGDDQPNVPRTDQTTSEALERFRRNKPV